MKSLLRKLFSPILNIFERGTEPYKYQPLGRKILIVMGILFAGLACVTLYFLPFVEQLGYLISVVVFGAISLVSLVIGFLGSERAVAKIWGDR